jgi:hypothetical protein
MTNTDEYVIRYRLHSGQITQAKADLARVASCNVQKNYLYHTVIYQ